MKLSYPQQTIFHLSFFNGTLPEATAFIEKCLASNKLIRIATPNPEHIVQAQHDPKFQKNLRQFEVFLPDGTGIIWASRKVKKPLQSRIAGVDMVAELLRISKQQALKVLVIGGRGYQGELTVSATDVSSVKTLQVKENEVFWVEGYRDIVTMSEEDLKEADKKVLAHIRSVQPQIVFVALGAPHQEAWVIRNSVALTENGVKIAMVVGGAFDFLTGKVARAPHLIQQLHLEWLFRLIQEPWRWRRQLRLIEFVKLVMRYSK